VLTAAALRRASPQLVCSLNGLPAWLGRQQSCVRLHPAAATAAATNAGSQPQTLLLVPLPASDVVERTRVKMMREMREGGSHPPAAATADKPPAKDPLSGYNDYMRSSLVGLGFGRIVVADAEVPNLLANLV
jgi:hypothetical protein